MILEYIDDLKENIYNYFKENLFEIYVGYAYESSSPKSPSVYLYLMDNSEPTSNRPLDNEKFSNLPIQAYVYGCKKKIGDTIYSPYQTALKLSDTLNKFLNRNNTNNISKYNIVSFRRVSMTPPMAINDEIFYVAIRYDITIETNIKENENNE